MVQRAHTEETEQRDDPMKQGADREAGTEDAERLTTERRGGCVVSHSHNAPFCRNPPHHATCAGRKPQISCVLTLQGSIFLANCVHEA
jgi:hypothetical protein